MYKNYFLLLLIPLFFIAPPLLSNTFVSPISTTVSSSGLNTTLGYAFNANNNLVVSALGMWAAPSYSGTGQIGLWDNAGQLLGQASVNSSGGTLFDSYRYADLTTPIFLTAGQTYYLGVYTPSLYQVPLVHPSTPWLSSIFTIDPSITIFSGAYNNGGFSAPLNLIPTNYYMAGNAQFSVVTPEPGTYLMLGSLLGIAAIAAMKKRRVSEEVK